MKKRHAPMPLPASGEPPGFPDANELAMLRAWYAGLAVRPAVERYLPSALGDGKSARGVLGHIRRRLPALARAVHREDLVTLLGHPVAERQRHAKAVAQAIDILRTARSPEPRIADDIAQWFTPRAVRVLRAYGITTRVDRIKNVTVATLKLSQRGG